MAGLLLRARHQEEGRACLPGPISIWSKSSPRNCFTNLRAVVGDGVPKLVGDGDHHVCSGDRRSRGVPDPGLIIVSWASCWNGGRTGQSQDQRCPGFETGERCPDQVASELGRQLDPIDGSLASGCARLGRREEQARPPRSLYGFTGGPRRGGFKVFRAVFARAEAERQALLARVSLEHQRTLELDGELRTPSPVEAAIVAAMEQLGAGDADSAVNRRELVAQVQLIAGFHRQAVYKTIRRMVISGHDPVELRLSANGQLSLA